MSRRSAGVDQRRAVGDLFAQPLDEVVDRHTALDVAAPGVHAEAVVGDVVVADDEDVRQLLDCLLYTS